MEVSSTQVNLNDIRVVKNKNKTNLYIYIYTVINIYQHNDQTNLFAYCLALFHEIVTNPDCIFH